MAWAEMNFPLLPQPSFPLLSHSGVSVLELSWGLGMATFLVPIQEHYGEDRLRAWDTVLDLFRYLTFLRRCLPAYMVFSNLAPDKERASPSFLEAGVVSGLQAHTVKCLGCLFEGQHISI